LPRPRKSESVQGIFNNNNNNNNNDEVVSIWYVTGEGKDNLQQKSLVRRP
jgi:hypothetical protein